MKRIGVQGGRTFGLRHARAGFQMDYLGVFAPLREPSFPASVVKSQDLQSS